MMKSLIFLCRRYKVATLLNLVGLGVAVAAFYLFMTQVVYNRTYNHSIPDHSRTYRLEIHSKMMSEDWTAMISRPMETILADIPQVEKTLATSMNDNNCTVSDGNRKIDMNILSVGQPGPAFFGSRLVSGSIKDWVGATTSIITRSAARRLFGTEEVVGRTYTRPVYQGRECTFTIVGVCEDTPANNTLASDIYESLGDENRDNSQEWSYHIYARLAPGTDPAQVARAMKLQVLKSFGVDKKDEKDFDEQVGMVFQLTSVDDIYFSGVSPQDKGNHNIVDVLTVSAIAIILFALLNLLNFTLSETPMRIRGINTRRVMGASVARLRLGIVFENVVISAVGTVIGAALVLAFAHSADCMQLVSGSIAFADHPLLAAATVATALAVGALSAIVPAAYSTSFAPALVLKGSFGLSPRGRRLRMAIMAVQFCVAFVLVVYVGVMTAQSHYIFHSDYGFNKDEVFFASLSPDATGKKEAIRTELKRLPFVTHVGYAQSTIGAGDTYMTWGRQHDDYIVSYAALPCDAEYLQTIGIKLVEGRTFKESDTAKGAYIVNRNMTKKYNWIRVGEKMLPGESGMNYTVVGVCENFRLYSIRKDNASACAAFLIPGPDMASWGDKAGRVFVRTAKGYDKIEAKRQIAETLSRLDPSQPYEVRFLDDALQNTYTDEFRFIAQVRMFALISIVITLIGVFCLAMFETEYRRKEIAIRKVMGSTVGQVMRLFAARYVLPLALSFAVAVPVALWLSRQWLQTFTEHAPISWWLFPLALVLVSAVVLLTVTAQCWHVATSNPVDSIKTE